MTSHCKNGHEMAGDNIVYRNRPGGGAQCRECKRINAAKRQRSKKEEYGPEITKTINRRSNLKHFYNMTTSEYFDKLLDQNWKCANPTCDRTETTEKCLHVDHDHSCCPDFQGKKRKSCGKCVRGLLCERCNLLLGLAEDNDTYLIGLAEYLKSWKNSYPISNSTLEETLIMTT